MVLKDKIVSKTDRTIKYVFQLSDGLIIEVSYLDNNTGKDIICVPTQTMCNMGCRFCCLSDYIGQIELRNLTCDEIKESVDFINTDLSLGENDRNLLVSYMGAGEPLNNIFEVLKSMLSLMSDYKNIRFGLATMIPKNSKELFSVLVQTVKLNKIPLKLHLSLHSVHDDKRRELIPMCLDIQNSLKILKDYIELTNNPIEIHYTLIKNETDLQNDLLKLFDLIYGMNVTLKFLKFNEKEGVNYVGSDIEKIKEFIKTLDLGDIKVEFYNPPGETIGASCGAFLMKYYLEYNKIKLD